LPALFFLLLVFFFVVSTEQIEKAHLSSFLGSMPDFTGERIAQRVEFYCDFSRVLHPSG
jgi:hypothetical protein